MTALRRVVHMRPPAARRDTIAAEAAPVAPPLRGSLADPAGMVAPPAPAKRTVPTRDQVRAPASTPARATLETTVQAAPIARFIDLENAFRQARDKETLRLALVNGARQFAPYSCAVLVECAASPLRQTKTAPALRWSPVAASDVARLESSARLGSELSHVLSAIEQENAGTLHEAQSLSLQTAQQAAPLLSGLAELCVAMPYMHWLPLRRPDGEMIGGLATFYATPPVEAGAMLLKGLALPYAHAWAALDDARNNIRRRLTLWLTTARKTHTIPIVAALILVAPVRFSVLAPAEIVGAQPMAIAAPLDGVIQDIHVNPGEMVKPGQPLVSFVDTKVRNEADVARKAHAVAFAKYQRALHTAVANHRDNHEIAIAKADADVAEAQLALAEDMLNRVRAVAPEGGIAVFAARSEWLGRPVATGERIMEIVDPADIQVRVDLPVADGIAFENGMALKVFLDGQPLGALDATLSTMSYRPVANMDNQMVYRLFATLTEGRALPRFGARGTARIDGPFVPLGFYLFRRPFAALRQKLGF